jgi:hypothetical protein
MGLHARCSPWFAPIAVRKPKYLLNHAVTSRCTAVIASVNKNQADKLDSSCAIYIGRIIPAYIFFLTCLHIVVFFVNLESP